MYKNKSIIYIEGYYKNTNKIKDKNMLNSINSNQNFGTMQITAFRKTKGLTFENVNKRVELINDKAKEKFINQMLNAYLPPNKDAEISEITSKKISEVIKMLTNIDLDPKNYDRKILSKINENTFVFGNDKVLENGAKTRIVFNV